MSFYAYCLLRLNSDEDWPVISGIDEHPVFPLRCGKYAMLLSRINSPFAFTPRSIVEHGQVISKAFEAHTVLPMRFATFFKSEKQIMNLIQENQKELLESFCRLRGKAEMRLKLMLPSNAPEPKATKKPCQPTNQLHIVPPTVSSDSAMDEKSRVLVQELASKLNDHFRPLEQQTTCRMVQSKDIVLDCAHLIETQKVGSYQRLHHSVSAQMKNCEIRLSGPWPPYHFLPTAVRMPNVAPVPLRRRAVANAR